LSLQPLEQDLAAMFRLFSRHGLIFFSDARTFHDNECNPEANDDHRRLSSGP
jgi:hypothetical protein